MRTFLLSATAGLALLAHASAARAVEPSLDIFLAGLSPGNIAASLRVVGGTQTKAELWPWQIFMIVPAGGGSADLCGGSLIAPRWVLTAAHCFNDWAKGTPVIVVEGMRSVDPTNLSRRVSKREYTTTKVFFDKYDKNTQTNDIALVQLPDAADSQSVTLQLTADDTLEETGRMTTITGWGVLKSVKAGPNGTMVDSQTGEKLTDSQFRTGNLMEVELPLVDLPTCQAVYKGSGGSIDQRNLCAGYKAGGKDSCQGDSGGPMVEPVADGSFRQIGVVSWGAGCARPGIPGIYTKVSAFSDWIRSTVGKDLVVADDSSSATTPVKPAVSPPPPPPVKPAATPTAQVSAPAQQASGTVHGAPAAPSTSPPPPPPPPPAAPVKPAQAASSASSGGGHDSPPRQPNANAGDTADAVDNNPAGIAVEIDGGDSLHLGQKVAFSVTAQKAGYLTLLDRGPDDSLTLVFPNEFSLRLPNGAKNDGKLTPDRPLVVPDKRNPYAGFEYVIDPPAGDGTLVAILSDAPLTADEIANGPKAFKSGAAAKAFVAKLAARLRSSVELGSDGEPGKPAFSISYHPYTISP